MSETKRCPHCGRTLPLGEYNRNRSMADGLSAHCRQCQHQLMREYRLRAIEALKADPNHRLHGKESGYCLGCRCERCKTAARIARYRRTTKNKDKDNNGER